LLPMYWNVATLMPPEHPDVTSLKLGLKELAATVAGGALLVVLPTNVPQKPALDELSVIADEFSFSIRSLLESAALAANCEARSSITASGAIRMVLILDTI
jgi:hypothetical protein